MAEPPTAGPMTSDALVGAGQILRQALGEDASGGGSSSGGRSSSSHTPPRPTLTSKRSPSSSSVKLDGASQGRSRSGSLRHAIDAALNDPGHHIGGGLGTLEENADSPAVEGSKPRPFDGVANGSERGLIEEQKAGERRPELATSPRPTGSTALKKGRAAKPYTKRESKGFIDDLKTLQWMARADSSLKLLLIPLAGYFLWDLLLADYYNPFEPFIFIQYRLDASSDDRGLDLQTPSPNPLLKLSGLGRFGSNLTTHDYGRYDPRGALVSLFVDPVSLKTPLTRYGKGPLDLCFILYHIVTMSFFRQVITVYLVTPIAKSCGLRGEGKIQRFTEQGYALAYYGLFGIVDIIIHSRLPTWWFRTDRFWDGYPHWRMLGVVKSYYLIQLAYWIQQVGVLAFGLEKPRKDFKELVIHHFVTIWLVGWSYTVNLTYIGNAVFLSMDVSDTALAFSKLLNYLGLELTSTISFAIFIGIWSYLRHYENLKILWSIWSEINVYIPPETQRFSPPEGFWMATWFWQQIMLPLFLLQLLNLIWYYLIWRIAIRTLRGSSARDDREDDDEEDEDEIVEESRAAKANDSLALEASAHESKKVR